MPATGNNPALNAQELIMTTTVAEHTTLRFNDLVELSGRLDYDADTCQLSMTYTDGEHDVLSTDLDSYGLTCDPGETFILATGEHADLAQSLIESGHCTLVDDTHLVGPYRTQVYRLRVIV